MLTAAWQGNEEVRPVVAEVPTASVGEALIEVEWCGICGSDLHAFRDGRGISPGTSSATSCPAGSSTLPASPRPRDRDRVVARPVLACGTCRRCFAGDVNLCERQYPPRLRRSGWDGRAVRPPPRRQRRRAPQAAADARLARGGHWSSRWRSADRPRASPTRCRAIAAWLSAAARSASPRSASLPTWGCIHWSPPIPRLCDGVTSSGGMGEPTEVTIRSPDDPARWRL